MCIGTALQVRAVEPGGEFAWCSAGGDGVRECLDMRLVGPQPPGTWVLAFQGAARQVMSAREAGLASAARQALAAALRGEAVDAFFADLVGRPPELPAHLRSHPPLQPALQPLLQPPLHPLLQRLLDSTGAAWLDGEGFEAWAAEPGAAMLVFCEAPERSRETLDIAVIVPELQRLHGSALRLGLLAPLAARAIEPRYGFTRWPALVLLRDGRYLGAIDGLRDWQVYADELARLLAATPARPPGIGIPLRADGAAPACR